jgi:2-polyprenyl-3-methyl-5-hydroxy-6-metoxy-1,4-benzoquinol methylase
MKEEEIRPQKIFNEYLRLAERDTQKYFDISERFPVCCPACGQNGLHSFAKHGFTYEECLSCQTLFVSPRPHAEAFSRYYQESESAEYWASTFYKETAEARREKLWRPKALMIRNLIERFGTDKHDLVDIGGGYGIFAQEYEKITGKKVTVIEPGPALAEVCRDKGLKVVQCFLEDIKPEQLGTGAKAFVSFELFEHLHDPEKFLRHLFDLMQTGDLFIFTTLSGVGVDIQALWEDSKSVSPPHHLNFLNPKSAQILLKRVGFEVLQTSTPGKLDIDILCNNQQYIKDRFWRTFAIQATEDEKLKMQSFIADNSLSSHMLLVCQKS